MQWPKFQPQPHAHPDGPRWQGVHVLCCLIGGSDVGINPTSSCLARLASACEEGQAPIKRESIAAIGEDETLKGRFSIDKAYLVG